MKKMTSILLTLCMLFGLFGGVVFFAEAANEYETVKLIGFDAWTQAELDTSSGNNGYANSCSTKLTVVNDAKYIVGEGKQAIKAVFGNSGTAYNNCIVNWKFQTGGPCTAGNVWAPADGSSVNYSDYDGIRIAVLNSNGEPANFSKITLRVTEGWNYSNNMRYWESAIERDAEGYFYFDFESFVASGSPAGKNIYDYFQNAARGISMLCYGGTDENTCYYSAVELYREAGSVRKVALKEAVDKLEGLAASTYAAEIAAAKAVLNSATATQDDVDAQLEIIQKCIKAYNIAASTGYTYVQLDGIQNWTQEEASSMNGFGAKYSISDKGLVGDAKQSLKLTATQEHNRFCFATQKSNGAFSTINPYKLSNPEDGKLSDYDGIAIAFCDENGNEIEISKFVARLMRNSSDWDSYWTYEAGYIDMDACFVNGYYHLKFSDYSALGEKGIDDLTIMSILFYRGVNNGDTAYISDMKAYKYETPEVTEYEYLQLDGVQKWTEADLANTSANNGHVNNVTATYSISDLWLVGGAAQSIKAVKSSAGAQFNCLVNKAYDSDNIAAPSPWRPSDRVSKLSSYDGVMIAVCDQNGERPVPTEVKLRILNNPGVNGWGSYQESKVYEFTEDGYMKFSFSDFPNPEALLSEIDTSLGISFLISDKGQTEYYFSDFKAYRIKSDVDFTELQKVIETMKNNNPDGKYDSEIAAAEALVNSDAVTQADINAKISELNRVIREILLKPVEFDEDNIVVSFGAVSDVHINANATDSNAQKYIKALQLLKKYSGNKLDAITIAGDISASSYDSGIGSAFQTITDAELGEDANVFFVTGNHDAQSGQWNTLAQFYSDFAKYTADDLTSSQHDRGNRHKVINGYHYIAVNMMDYWNSSEAMFDTRDLEWLAKELEAARKDAPGQPIFVYVHAGVYGTTYGSDLYTGNYWGSKLIHSYLENYPEVVTFSGHVHFPLADERTIYQKNFTSLNCGSVQYMAIENGYLQTGGKTTCDASWGVSSGLLVQVDKNNNLKITRLDFANDSIIKQPFYISAPDLENKSNLLHYNDDYFNLDNTAPVFSKSASVVGKVVGSNVEVTFDSAIDNDMVHHYVIEIKGLPSGITKSVKAFSEFYLYPTAKDFPKTYTMKVPYTPAEGDEAFEIALYAVDSMRMQSEPIRYNSIVDAVNIPLTEGQNLVNIDFITGEARNTTAIQNTITANNIPVIKVNGKYGYAASAESKFSFRPGNSVNTLSARKFVTEAAFTVGSIGTAQSLISCLKDGKGYNLYITPEGKIAFTLSTTKGSYSVESETVVNTGEYHNVIVQFSSNLLTLYLDGVSTGSVATTGNPSFSSTTPYTIGSRTADDGSNVDCFDGVIYQVGIGSNILTEEQISARWQAYVDGISYKTLRELYNELGYAKEIVALNADNAQACEAASNYVTELEYAISAAPISDSFIASVIRREDFVNTIRVLAGVCEIPETEAPVVSGVEDGAQYDLFTDKVIPTWGDATMAELNFETITSGEEITAPGKYQLIVVNKQNSTVVEFTVVDTSPVYEIPVISGVTEGEVYDLYLGQAPIITFDVGTATLNGEEFVSGSAVSAVGQYVLVVVNGDKQVTINFTIEDTTPQYKKGDFDGDGKISVADALVALRIAAKMAECTETAILIGDIDADGEITVSDSLAILRVAAKMADSL